MSYEQLESSADVVDGFPQKGLGRLALLRSNSPPANRLIELVEDACAEGPEAFGNYARDILILQLRLPEEVLERRPIKDFIFGAACGEDVSCRLNACHLLERMTSGEARDLLRTLGNDSDERVRRNAILSLRSA